MNQIDLISLKIHASNTNLRIFFKPLLILALSQAIYYFKMCFYINCAAYKETD